MDERKSIDKAFEESTFLLSEDAIHVVAPNTERAFVWWARDTQWAAGEGQGLWAECQADGPVLVVGVENQKYLFHAATCRFLDAHRQPASAYGVLGDVLWRLISRRLPELAFALIFSSPFSEGPGVSAGERAIASAVLRLGLPLEQVPERLRSELVCLAAVRRSTAALAHVPEDPRMQPVFLEVVKRYGDLNLVPPSMRDLEVCAAAVQRDSDAWYLVPPELTNRLRTRLAATSDVASSSRPLTLKTFK